MKFFTTFAVLIATAVAVSAIEVEETNAARMARGLPPKAPHKRRGSPTFNAPEHKPSQSPGQCHEFLGECKRDEDCCWGPCIWGFCDL